MKPGDIMIVIRTVEPKNLGRHVRLIKKMDDGSWMCESIGEPLIAQHRETGKIMPRRYGQLSEDAMRPFI
jgi:hypothetical protein